jgi:hypothetical protein
MATSELNQAFDQQPAMQQVSEQDSVAARSFFF